MEPEVLDGEEVEVPQDEADQTKFYYTEEGEVFNGGDEIVTAQDMENAPEGQWSIQKIWNDIVDLGRREPKVRDYISFSDIGKSDLWSRYMKMKGVPASNEFDNRVLRIFEAGVQFHDLIKVIFKKAGVFINSQDDLDKNGELQWTEIEPTDTALKQFGAYDVLVGGKPDLEGALKWIEQSDLSEFGKEKARRIANYFADKFPNGLEPIIYDIKSVNSQAFWAKKAYLWEAYPHHRFQLFGYLKGNANNEHTLSMVREKGIQVDKIKEARLLYISKDDLTIAEFPVRLEDETLAANYTRDVEAISHYVRNNIEPPKPPYVVFNPRKMHGFQHLKKKYKVRGSWEFNWEVVRSPYFTLMTGYKTVDEFKYAVKEEISNKNKAIKGIVLAKVGITLKESKIDTEK